MKNSAWIDQRSKVKLIEDLWVHATALELVSIRIVHKFTVIKVLQVILYEREIIDLSLLLSLKYQ